MALEGSRPGPHPACFRVTARPGTLAPRKQARETSIVNDSSQGMASGTAVRAFDGFAALLYLVAFVTGAIVMSFEMLGSRYLNPYFGSGIYTWASLISTVLAALTVGYFLGGALADRKPSVQVLGSTIVIGSAHLPLLPPFAPAAPRLVLAAFADPNTRSVASASAIMLVSR